MVYYILKKKAAYRAAFFMSKLKEIFIAQDSASDLHSILFYKS